MTDMSITFNEFILEANIAGSRPRPVGKDILTAAERARVSTRRDRSPIQRTGGGVSYVTVAPEIEKPEPPQKKETPKSRYLDRLREKAKPYSKFTENLEKVKSLKATMQRKFYGNQYDYLLDH